MSLHDIGLDIHGLKINISIEEAKRILCQGPGELSKAAASGIDTTEAVQLLKQIRQLLDGQE